MQISAQALFTAIKEDPKQAKALIKSASTLDISATNSSSEKLIAQKAMESGDRVLDKLFSKLSNGSISKEQAVKTVQNSLTLKTDTLATLDMKNLVQLAQKEPKLSKFVEPLKDFLKHVSSSNGENLKNQVVNSGIGLESKLLSQSNEPKLPNDLKAILNEIVKEQSVIKNLDSSSKIVDLTKNLLNANETFKEDIKSLRQELLNVLKNSPQPKTTQEVQNLLKTLDKLESLVDAKEQKIANLAPKEQTQAKQDISNPTTSIDKKLQNIIKDLPAKLSQMDKTKIQKGSLAKLENLAKEIDVLAKSLEAKPLDKSQTQLLNTLVMQNMQTNSTQNLDTSLNVQDRLKMMIVKLKQSIELMDKSAFKANEGQKFGKEVLKSIDRNLQNLPSKPSSDGQSAIKQDIKHSLVNIKEASSNQSSQNMRDINSLATKTLTHIEANQLISYANNTINTYVPYMWEGLKEGNVAFKGGKDDSFYCQIDLNLKIYGRVNMMLMLSNDSYISISISTEKDSLKEKIDENLRGLKQSLSKIGLIPLHVKFKPFEKESEYSDEWGDFSMNLKV